MDWIRIIRHFGSVLCTEMDDGTRYVAVFPSDVQFNPEFADDYQDLYKDAESVVGTFTLVSPQGQ